MQNLEILEHVGKPASKACSSQRAGEDTGSSLRSVMLFGDQQGISAKDPPAARLGQLAAAHRLHSWDSRRAWPIAQETPVQHSSRVVQNTPAVLSDARKCVVLARPETGILHTHALPLAQHRHVRPNLPHPPEAPLL